MRFDRVHALGQASYFEDAAPRTIAAVVSAGLDAKERLGRSFADGALGQTAPEGVRNNRRLCARRNADLALDRHDGVRAPAARRHGRRHARRTLIADGSLATIVSGYGAYVVAVSFDAATLAPPALLDRAAVTTASGMPMIGTATGGRAIQAAARSWPVLVSITPDDDGALGAWYGSLPLYLFVILGPRSPARGWHRWFVGEFERRTRANRAVKNLARDAVPPTRGCWCACPGRA